MQRLTIDLKSNPKVADLVADLEPSEKIDATLVIVAKDDQTLTVDLEGVHEHDASMVDDEDTADGGADDASESDSPAMQVARGAKDGG